MSQSTDTLRPLTEREIALIAEAASATTPDDADFPEALANKLCDWAQKVQADDDLLQRVLAGEVTATLDEDGNLVFEE